MVNSTPEAARLENHTVRPPVSWARHGGVHVEGLIDTAELRTQRGSATGAFPFEGVWRRGQLFLAPSRLRLLLAYAHPWQASRPAKSETTGPRFALALRRRATKSKTTSAVRCSFSSRAFLGVGAFFRSGPTRCPPLTTETFLKKARPHQ